MWLRLRHPNLPRGYFFLDRGADVQIRRTAQIRVGHGVRISRDFTAFLQGRVLIGNNVFFNGNCHLAAHLGVTVGDNCLFGERVSIHDANHALAPVDQPAASREFEAEEIIRGTKVWVSANVTILPGVHIGDNAVIGANAVVTHDIPANCVADGIPRASSKHSDKHAVVNADRWPKLCSALDSTPVDP
jgi:acetyltransferase-like isoleucine patch superfamily enzyme